MPSHHPYSSSLALEQLPAPVRLLWENLQQEEQRHRQQLNTDILFSCIGACIVCVEGIPTEHLLPLLIVLLQILEDARRFVEPVRNGASSDLWNAVERIVGEHLRVIILPVVGKWFYKFRNAGLFNNTSYDKFQGEMDVLTRIAYSYVFEALQKSHSIDVTQDLYAYFRVIAHRGLIKEYKAHCGFKGKSPPPMPITSGTPEAQMWSDLSSAPRSGYFEAITIPADDEEARVDQLEAERLEDKAWHYIKNEARFSDTTKRILHHRLRCDPPTPFKQIASELGEGWTENNVTQAFGRARKKVKRYLETLDED